MRIKWRLLGGVSLFAVLALALTGCMRVQRTIHLNEGGSGAYTLTVGFQEPRPNDQTSLASSIVTTMDAFGAHVQQTGGSYTRYEDQGYAYWSYSRPFTSVAAANALFQEGPQQYDPQHTPLLFHDSLRIVTESSAFSTVYHVTGQISLADPLGRATTWRDASESIAITLPDGISSHQGGAQDGETVTYTIYYNQTATIDVVGSASTGVAARVTRVISAGVLLTLAIILAVLGFRFFRRPFGNKQVK